MYWRLQKRQTKGDQRGLLDDASCQGILGLWTNGVSSEMGIGRCKGPGKSTKITAIIPPRDEHGSET